jgi:hypothetical protein
MALSRESRMCIKNVTFSSEDAPYTVILSSLTIEQMVSECLKAGVNETGGILRCTGNSGHCHLFFY